jgi:phosphatidylinositol glycan class Q protein
LKFKAMFHQYFQMGHRIRKHYLSPRVLLCLLTGQFVPPLNRKNLYSLQYSMLPARRAGVMEMWNAVNSLPDSSSSSSSSTSSSWERRKGVVPVVQVPVLANGRRVGMGAYGGRVKGFG